MKIGLIFFLFSIRILAQIPALDGKLLTAQELARYCSGQLEAPKILLDSIFWERRFLGLDASFYATYAPRRGKNVRVVVIDAGVFHPHISLMAQDYMVYNHNFCTHGTSEQHLPTISAGPLRNTVQFYCANHGNCVAGLIAGKSDVFCGIAPDVDIIAYKIFDHTGRTHRKSLLAALEAASVRHADIINISASFGAVVAHDDEVVRALNKCADGGALVVVPEQVPCMHPRIVRVSAHGPVLENTKKVYKTHSFIRLPGKNILSCAIDPHHPETPLFMFMSGTSIATACMTGLLALLIGESRSRLSPQNLLTLCYQSTYDQGQHDALFDVVSVFKKIQSY